MGSKEIKKSAIKLKQNFEVIFMIVVKKAVWETSSSPEKGQYGRLLVVLRKGKTHTTTNKIEKDLADLAIKSKRQELRLAEIGAAYSVMKNTTTVLQTAIGRVDTTLSNATYYTSTLVRQNLLSELSEEEDNPPSFYEIFPVHKQFELNLFIFYLQVRKHDREPKEEDDTKEEFNAD
ncbi:12543_t:CDS:2 [Funneliformis caledonium]|uniref:12543_t:CDS:1 n=1 Tax=Funneliformis caledonium TaxID=1117310 RepID=A0A9N9EJG5_9GLOM|nr:12543_t:CDS:2 [Funneliformis caledonium]